ncbi:Pyrrolo-quinoline quinone repeat [Dillenia turbinata]|uniref:Pyrrolo-quinoline quinone repeat n=1 Tax=Dillenia turbinata TaxID=194707 RepID=A0AAN8Z2G6_9MAGN
MTSLNAVRVLTICTNAMWYNHGGDLTNRRQAVGEILINRMTVANLKLRWKFYAGKDISATPAISDGVVYFPSWNGVLYAVSAFTGNLVWQQNLGEITGLSGTGVSVNVSVARAAPTVAGPAVVIAMNRLNGNLVWSTQRDMRPHAVITTSGTFYNGEYIVSSLEETLPAGQCCTFRGSLAKLNLQTGAVVWRTYTLPDNGGNRGGYSGEAIWGSSPAIDISRNLVYAATGNIYTAPDTVEQCEAAQSNQTRATHPDQCIGPDVNFNSILAFNMDSGKIVWSRQLGGYDIFYVACLIANNPDCPPGPNLDADFGVAPMLLTVFPNGTRRDVVVAVQKSGFVWALDRDNGNIVWFNLAGPGGREGVRIWGAATDGRRVYTNIVNSNRVNFVLAPSNKTTNYGAWVALDANTGEMAAQGPVTIVNDVLFAGSVASNGPLYAMDAETGKILWSYNTVATIYGGVSASYGCIYLGNGYREETAAFHPNWTPGVSLYAFCIF